MCILIRMYVCTRYCVTKPLPDCTEPRLSRTMASTLDQWNESFKSIFPDLAILRFVVMDDDTLSDDFIGQYSLPLESLAPGQCVSVSVCVCCVCVDVCVCVCVCLLVAVLLLPCSTKMCRKDCREQVASTHSRSAKSDGGYSLLYIINVSQHGWQWTVWRQAWLWSAC